jgi:hypothetical protein
VPHTEAAKGTDDLVPHIRTLPTALFLNVAITPAISFWASSLAAIWACALTANASLPLLVRKPATLRDLKFSSAACN